MAPDAPGNVVWTDVALRPEARETLARSGTAVVVAADPAAEPPPSATALIVGSRFRGDASCFDRLPALRVVARVGIGHERIDLAAATARGICVVNTPDAPTESTAEFAVLLLLATARRLVAGRDAMRAGDWPQDAGLVGTDLAHKTLGLIGCGRIGRRVAEIAGALRLRVVAFDPHVADLPASVERADSLAALLPQADFLSLHAPASPGMRPLLGAAEFAACKPGVIVINTARGPLIDETALLAALESGPVAAAALDVWDSEPPARDHPLRTHPKVLPTPHMGAFTREGQGRSHRDAANQALQVLADERPAALVNPAVWDQRRRGGQRYRQ